MRSLCLVVLLAACGGRATHATLPTQSPSVAPARDLAAAKDAAPRAPADAHLVAKDPRVIDLDIIRITATSHGVGGDPEMNDVATADLFKQANAAAKSGDTERALQLYHQLVIEFPDSQFAPVALFNIAAIFDGRGDVAQTVQTLRELVKAYPTSRESIDGHLYIAALQSDKEQFADALATLDEVLARTN